MEMEMEDYLEVPNVMLYEDSKGHALGVDTYIS